MTYVSSNLTNPKQPHAMDFLRVPQRIRVDHAVKRSVYLVLIDTYGNILLTNDATQKAFNLDAFDRDACNLYSFIHPKYLPTFRSIISEAGSETIPCFFEVKKTTEGYYKLNWQITHT